MLRSRLLRAAIDVSASVYAPELEYRALAIPAQDLQRGRNRNGDGMVSFARFSGGHPHFR